MPSSRITVGVVLVASVVLLAACGPSTATPTPTRRPTERPPTEPPTPENAASGGSVSLDDATVSDDELVAELAFGGGGGGGPGCDEVCGICLEGMDQPPLSAVLAPELTEDVIQVTERFPVVGGDACACGFPDEDIGVVLLTPDGGEVYPDFAVSPLGDYQSFCVETAYDLGPEDPPGNYTLVFFHDVAGEAAVVIDVIPAPRPIGRLWQDAYWFAGYEAGEPVSVFFWRFQGAGAQFLGVAEAVTDERGFLMVDPGTGPDAADLIAVTGLSGEAVACNRNIFGRGSGCPLLMSESADLNDILFRRTDAAFIPALSQSVAVCPEPCTDDLSNWESVYPEGTTTVYNAFYYANLERGMPYVRIWEYTPPNSSETYLWAAYECVWEGPSTGRMDLTLNEPAGLASGSWRQTIDFMGVTTATGYFAVEGNNDYFDPIGEAPCPDW